MVVFFSGEKNNHISIDKSVFFHALQSSQRVYEIEQGKEKQFVMIKEIQYHPVTDEIIHVDLMRVRRSEKMTILVPLGVTQTTRSWVGKSPVIFLMRVMLKPLKS